MATNGTSNGANGINVSGWKHYNEGTFLFTVSCAVLAVAFLPRLRKALKGADPDRYSSPSL
jgi:hypothetical protein